MLHSVAFKGKHFSTFREQKLAKSKSAFVCTDCGADYTKWQGQCTACNAWNTLSEIRLSPAAASRKSKSSGYAGTVSSGQKLSEIDVAEEPRTSSGFAELDRVFGGGMVLGSAVLIGGEPGAGKSTLLLQMMCELAKTEKALYVTGEESPQQIALRAKRLGLPTEHLSVMAETSLDAIMATLEKDAPKILVVDSIQVVYREDIASAPGSVSQVRECAAELVRFSKQRGTILILVGHVTKEGSLAGPKVLEHMIDCSLLLESSDDSRYRMLRSRKNRFGAVNELGVFAMTDTGMKEVGNPSAIFLSRNENTSSGSIVTSVWEGSRPLLVEIQALADANQYQNPRRVVVGLEANRLAMLVAVLHRHAGIAVGDQDIFLNVVGGVRITETGADLPAILAILSSMREREIPRDLIAFGEVGLAGELRPVSNGQERLREAAKQGFSRAVVPYANRPQTAIKGMKVIAAKTLVEAVEVI